MAAEWARLSLAAALMLAAMSGCASVSVNYRDRNDVVEQGRMPSQVYVRDFWAPEEVFAVDRTGADLTMFRLRLAETLSDRLAQSLTRHFAPSERLPGGSPLPADGWIVEGRFDKVRQGSRALRTVVGLGLGGTKVATTVVVSRLVDGQRIPFLAMNTTGGSGAMPGVVPSINPLALLTAPIGIAGGVAAGVTSGLGFDVKRTAREITAVITTYAAEHNIIPSKERMTPKQSGKLRVALPGSDPVRKND